MSTVQNAWDFNKAPLVELISDESFHAELVKVYSGANIQRDFSARQLQQQLAGLYGYLVSKSYDAMARGERELAFDNVKLSSIRDHMLIVAQLGLSLDPRQKEVYLNTERDMSGHSRVTIVFGVDGISLLLNKCNSVASVSSNIVYEGDTFEWFGEELSPTYIHPLENAGNDVMCAFGRIRLTDGSFRCTLIPGHEIAQVKEAQIEYAMRAGVTSPWVQYASKCIRAMVLRRLFNERAKELSILDANLTMGESLGQVRVTSDRDGVINQDDFGSMLHAAEKTASSSSFTQPL